MDLDIDSHLHTLEIGKDLSELTIVQILTKVKEYFFQENALLEIASPVTICGDIHGQFPDLLELFSVSGSPSTQTYLFMGDYVDRGEYSLRTFVYLTLLKLKFPMQFFMLRGNHESRNVTKTYGFHQEILERFGHLGIWDLANEVFDLLPLSALINNEVFSVHGGLSPNLIRLEDFVKLDRVCEIPPDGPITDLTWSDPDPEATIWRPNVSRGSGFVFGRFQVAAFCRINGDLKLITRSHELVRTGTQWLFDGKFVTVWSAPNYNRKADQTNPGAVLKYVAPEEHEVVMFRARPSGSYWKGNVT
jgi:diadenosine tetraphosphatase ApaH/serine/threonine PP2A family protein phosphatase